MIVLYIISAVIGLIIILYLIGNHLSNKHNVDFNNHYTPHFYNDFPDKEDGTWLPQKKIHDYNYDENFHYRYGQTAKEKFLRSLVTFLSLTITPLLVIFDGGAIYKTKKKFKELRKKFKDGFISVSNHCYEYEVLMIRRLNYGRPVYFPMWKEGAEGPSGTFYRAGGGIPLVHSMRGLALCMREMENVLKEGKQLHVFPEAAGWFYYAGIRSFQEGAFRIAYKLNKPIIPMATSFRERKGIWRLFGSKNKPLVCLSVGDPIYPNLDNNREEEITRLAKESREAVMHLAGIKDEAMNERIKNSYSYYPYDATKSQY